MSVSGRAPIRSGQAGICDQIGARFPICTAQTNLWVSIFIYICAGLNATRPVWRYTFRAGETKPPFQFAFNTSLKIDFPCLRVTSDGDLILVRELDDRLGSSKLMDQRLAKTWEEQ
jgi:hypothetical protein